MTDAHFELKSLSREAIPAALEKAERYRLLNEPWAAESICLDVLAVEPDNQRAIVMLVLAVTDQFPLNRGVDTSKARDLLPRLTGEYARAYYAGIIAERWGKALLARNAPGSGPIVYDWLRQAMTYYERAEALSPPDNQSAISRWNTCARIIMGNRRLQPAAEERVQTFLE
jgi:hypothetical protein